MLLSNNRSVIILLQEIRHPLSDRMVSNDKREIISEKDGF